MPTENNHRVIIDFTAMVVIIATILFLLGLSMAIGRMEGMALGGLFFSSPTLYDGLMNGFTALFVILVKAPLKSLGCFTPLLFVLYRNYVSKSPLSTPFSVTLLGSFVLFLFATCLSVGVERGKNVLDEVLVYYSDDAVMPTLVKPVKINYQNADNKHVTQSGLLTNSVNGIYILFQQNRTLTIYPSRVVSIEFHHR